MGGGGGRTIPSGSRGAEDAGHQTEGEAEEADVLFLDKVALFSKFRERCGVEHRPALFHVVGVHRGTTHTELCEPFDHLLVVGLAVALTSGW